MNSNQMNLTDNTKKCHFIFEEIYTKINSRGPSFR